MRPAALRAFLPGLAFACLMAGLACSDESSIGPGAVVAVRIVPDTMRIVIGRSDTALAYPLDQKGGFLPRKQVDWATGDPLVATVNAKGEVTAVSIDTTDLTATSDGITGTATIIVEPNPAIGLSTDTIALTAIAGSGVSPAGNSAISNIGGGTLDGLALGTVTYQGGPTGWLTALLDVPVAPATLSVSANIAGLALGRYTATVPVTSTSASNSPRDVTVVLDLVAGAPATMAVQAGNNQTAQVNTAVATPPAVVIKDAFGNPVSGVGVTFAVASGGGSVTGAAPTTNASGVAAVTTWKLGITVGSNSLTATSAGLTAVTFNATASVGPAAILSKNAGDNQAATAGTAVPVAPRVLVTDQFGNPVPGVAITFAVASGGGSITGANQTTNASGLAAVASWTLGTVAGSNTLTASAAGLGSVTFTATGNPGSASAIAANGGTGQSGTVATTLPTALSALVTDNLANPVPGFTVGWAVTSGGGTINCGSGPVTSCSIATNGSGITSVTWTLGTTAGTQQVTASAGGLTGSPVTFSATATAGAPASMAKSAGDNQSATVNTAVAVNPAVHVTDQFGNPVSGVAVTFTVATGGGSVNCGAGNTGSCNVNTNASGIATVTSWTLGTVSGANNNTLTASRSGLSSATFTASGTPGAVDHFSLTAGNGQTARPGTTVATAPSVAALDAFNNPVPGVAVTFTITGGGGVVNCGFGNTTACNVTTNAGGAATVVSWTLSNGGTVNANGTYTNTLGVSRTGATSNSFTATAQWSFSLDVSPILSTSCSGCHPGIEVYTNIVNVPSSCFSKLYIQPGSTAGSFLYEKIISSTPTCGSQMPAGGPFLPAATTNIIRDWINNNAPAN